MVNSDSIDAAEMPFHAVKRFLDLLTVNYDDSRIVVECSNGKMNAKFVILLGLLARFL